MFYTKNVPGWKRAAHVLAGLLMVLCGLLGLKDLPLGNLVAISGVITGLT